MKHSRTHFATAPPPQAPSRGMSNNTRAKALRSSKQADRPGEPIEDCYRTLLETSNSAILLLSPKSIILGWNRAAEMLSGWSADKTLGQSYVALCLPVETRKSFLAMLAQVTAGSEARGFESPLLTHTNSQSMLSWNISRVLSARGNLIGLMAIGTTLPPHNETENTLRLTHASLSEEARRIQMATEEERRRIAREIHDEFGQALTGLKFDLAWLSTKLMPSPTPSSVTDLTSKVRAMSGSVDALLESVRATAAALRPAMLDDLGLVPALECLATTFQRRTGARCTVEATPGFSSPALPPEVSTALFRIAQELLTNILRHAGASQVRMRLHRSHHLATLEVADNGRGITNERMAAPRSFGLRGMQERTSLLGGHFRIVGTPGVGTTAIASMPVAECVAHD
ncbi:MAG: histidine kinase [Nitrospirae bacterium]|nr:histidine kinase [Nitrospirota bacterium]